MSERATGAERSRAFTKWIKRHSTELMMKMPRVDTTNTHTHTIRVLTIDSIGGSPPASKSSTFHSGFSVNRLATTDPAEPAPTTMKSYSSSPFSMAVGPKSLGHISGGEIAHWFLTSVCSSNPKSWFTGPKLWAVHGDNDSILVDGHKQTDAPYAGQKGESNRQAVVECD